jgi:hypothetical protein
MGAEGIQTCRLVLNQVVHCALEMIELLRQVSDPALGVGSVQRQEALARLKQAKTRSEDLIAQLLKGVQTIQSTPTHELGELEVLLNKKDALHQVSIEFSGIEFHSGSSED